MDPVHATQLDFAVNLLREASLAQPTASLVVSPISVAIALSMVYVGARNETKSQLNKFFAGPKGISDENFYAHCRRSIEALSAEHKNYTLELANRVFVQENLEILSEFRNTVQAVYKAPIEEVDFREIEATKINGFVAEKTHNKIKDIVSPENLNADASAETAVFLINAIYFKGTWKTQFDKVNTQKKAFYISEGKKKRVDTMHLTSDFIYFDDDGIQVLGLPYAGEETYMFIILPDERFGLQAVLKKLSGKKLAELVANRETHEVEVYLPRFKAENTLKLNDILRKQGLTNVFENADFSGITTKKSLYVNQVVQKAFIEVNEEGAEAAAATGIEGSNVMPAVPHVPPVFDADHPFAYAIIDKQGRILFLGHASDVV